MALADQWTPTRALANDTLLTQAGGIPTGKGVKMPKAWVPPDFGAGQDDDEDPAPAPPISEQGRDAWYAAALPNQAPPYVDPNTPPPVVAPAAAAYAPPARAASPAPGRTAPASAAPSPPPASPPAGGGGSAFRYLPAPTRPPSQSPFQTMPASRRPPSQDPFVPLSTVAVSGSQDVGGDWKSGLSKIGMLAKKMGFDNEGAQVAMAIARTEAGLFGAVGDNGQSFGVYQFYTGGQLANFAKYLGVSEQQAGQYAIAHPLEAAAWALNGYLGAAIKQGQKLGLHGTDLATYAQQHGQVSQSPERAGQWYDLLFSGPEPRGLGTGGQGGVGRGQDVGVGDDWYNDPNLNTAPQPAAVADASGGITNVVPGYQEPPPVPAPPPPPAAPILTPTMVIGGYQKAGVQPPQKVLDAASQQFANTQTPESQAASTDAQITTDVPGMTVPPAGSPLSRSIQGGQLSGGEQLVSGAQGVLGASQSNEGASLASGVPQEVAKQLLPSNLAFDIAGDSNARIEPPLVAGAIASAFDPLSYAGEVFKGAGVAAKALAAPAKVLPDPVARAVEKLVAGENGADMASQLWHDRIGSVLGKPGTGLNTRDAASAFESGHPFALSGAHPDAANLAKDMESFANATGDEGRTLKYIGGDVRNQSFPGQRYFPHVYEDTYTAAKRQAQSKGLNPANFYSNERTYPTLQDAIAAGKTPVDSVSQPFAHYAGAVLRSKARANFINDLKTAKTAGLDIMRPGGAKGKGIPEGWVWGGDILPHDQRFNQYWFEPQTAQVLKNITERSSSAGSRAILGTANQFKRSLLGLGTFHLVTEAGQTVGAAGPLKAPKIIARSLWNMWGPNFTKFRLDNIDLFQDAADAGVTFGFGGRAADIGTEPTSKLAQAATRAGVGGVIGGAYGYSHAKAQGADDQDAIRSSVAWAVGTGAATGLLGGAVEQAVFDRAIPTMKAMTYALYRDKFAPSAVASFVNRTYGGNSLRAIGRAPMVQNVMRGTLLASDWWEGWVRQIGNAFMPGQSGDLSRRYWAQMLGTAAFTLEGMNLVTGGHPTTDNEPGHQLELEVTNLYDKLGWSRRDPTTGNDMRVYWDVLGPLRPLATLAIAAGKSITPGGQNVLPGIGDQFGPTAAQFASSRVSPLIDVASQQMSGKDYFGNPLTPPGMDPAHQLADRIASEVGSFEPAPAQQFVQEQRRYGTAAAGVASTLGRRLSYETPTSQAYKQRDDAITQLGGNLQTAQDAVRQRTVQQDQTQTRIADLYTSPGGMTHAQIDQKEMDLRNQVPPLPDVYSDISGAPISPELAQALSTGIPGTASSDALADLPADAQSQIGALADAYWRPLPADQMASVDPNTQASIRRQKLQDMASQMNTDPATLLDAFKAQQRGMPMPPVGNSITSAEIESWVNDYVSASKDAATPQDAAAARGKVIDQIAADHPGLSSDTIMARINLRLTPAVTNVPEAEQSHQKALDLLLQARSAPEFVGPDGKPMGTPQQWSQWNDQIKAGERKQGIITRYDPAVQPLKDARDRGTAAKNKQMAQNPAYADYQRWFGEGRNMTETQWQSYTTDPGQRWKDHPTGQDAQSRVKVTQFYDTYTPQERRTIKVNVMLNGKVQPVPLEVAYQHFKQLEVPNWQSHLSAP